MKMKPNGKFRIDSLKSSDWRFAFVAIALALISPILQAQTLYVTNENAGTVGEYDATTGDTIAASFITNLQLPVGIAVSGTDLFVIQNYNGSTVGEYNAETGALITGSFASGLSFPYCMALSGSDLYVLSLGTRTIAEFNTVTGEEITSSLVGTVPAAIGVAVSGTNLYVMNTENNSVAEYNSTTGSEENGSLITGLYPSETALSAAGNYVYISDGGNVLEYSATSGSFIAYAADLSSPKGIAISGSNLYVAQGGANGTVAESNGNYISENSNFITGLDYPAFVAVSPIPEAECWYLVFLGVGLTCIVRCAERRQSTKPFAVPTINTCCLICFPVGYGKARP